MYILLIKEPYFMCTIIKTRENFKLKMYEYCKNYGTFAPSQFYLWILQL